MLNVRNNRKRLFYVLISVLVLIIVITLKLFTNCLGKPRYIYLEYWNGEIDKRFVNVDEVTEVWLGDETEFTRNKIKYCENLEYLAYSPHNFQDLNFIDNPTLTDLYIFGEGDDWSALGNCKSLESISIYESNFSDISLLLNMKNLKSLIIDTTHNLDFSGVDSLSSITSFTVKSPMIDMNDVCRLQSVMELYLCGGEIVDFHVIAEMERLESLYLYDIELTDFSSIYNIPSLQLLGLRNCNIPEDVKEKLLEKGVEVVEDKVKED